MPNENLLGISTNWLILTGVGIFIWLVIGAIIAAWIYKDSQIKKMKSVLWAIIGFFLAPIGLGIYFIARPTKAKRYCPRCGKEMLPSWDSCPFCMAQGERVETELSDIEPVISKTEPEQEPAVSQQEPAMAQQKATHQEETVAVGKQRKEEGRNTVKLETESVSPTLAWLIVKEGKRVGKEFRLQPDITSIGQDATNDIVIDDEAVSRQHAKVRKEDDDFVIHDLVSTNGTKVNGDDIAKHILKDGDEVALGETKLVFKRIQY